MKKPMVFDKGCMKDKPLCYANQELTISKV